MAALSSTLSSGTATIVAQPMRWGTYLKQYPKIPPFLARFAAEAKTEKKKAAAPAMGGMMMAAAPSAPQVSERDLRGMLQTIASEVAGVGQVEVDTPLMEAGMDSLSAVEFRNRFTSKVPGVNLPNTLIFDYPTIGAVAEYAVGQLGAVEGAPTMGVMAFAGGASTSSGKAANKGAAPPPAKGLELFYAGKVVGLNVRDGKTLSYQIEYDDGDFERGVPVERLRRVDEEFREENVVRALVRRVPAAEREGVLRDAISRAEELIPERPAAPAPIEAMPAHEKDGFAASDCPPEIGRASCRERV